MRVLPLKKLGLEVNVLDALRCGTEARGDARPDQRRDDDRNNTLEVSPPTLWSLELSLPLKLR